MINFELFGGKNITEITESDLKEKCPKLSTVSEIIYERSAYEKISEIFFKIAPYQKVLLVSTPTPYKLYGEEISNRILEAKNILKEYIFKTSVNGDYSEVKEVIDKAEEDTKVIAVLGGGTITDIAKFAAHKLNIPLVVIPTTLSAAACSDFGFITDGVSSERAAYKMTAAKCVIVSTDVTCKLRDKFTASAYGELIGKIIQLFNCNYAKIMQGQLDLNYMKILKECSNFLPQINSKILEGNTEANDLILQCLFACAMLNTNGSDFVSDDILAALKFDNTRLLGENIFLSSVFLSKLYRVFFKQKAFGYSNFFDVITYLKRGGKIDLENKNLTSTIENYKLQIKNSELVIYKLVEFNAEFKSEVDFLENIVCNCLKTFKRTYFDAGYSILKSIDEKTVKNAFVSVTNSQNIITPLMQIKSFGLIDEFFCA